MRGLQAELEELERTDPVVAEAARRMYDPEEGVLAQIRRYNRHLAARRAVGKRAMPEGER
jgi:hypothetical protein